MRACVRAVTCLLPQTDAALLLAPSSSVSAAGRPLGLLQEKRPPSVEPPLSAARRYAHPPPPGGSVTFNPDQVIKG